MHAVGFNRTQHSSVVFQKADNKTSKMPIDNKVAQAAKASMEAARFQQQQSELAARRREAKILGRA